MAKYRIAEPISAEAERDLFAFPPLLRRLLASRGVRSADAAEQFLNPSYDRHTHDPFLMKDMEKAVARILRALRENERIAIWSDYDADGIPGAVALHDFFKKLGFGNFENYIPDRHGEGFGLSHEGVEALVGRGARLIITVDCGMTDVAAAARANELGAEVVITDHHLPNGGGAPKVCAILNPKQPDCAYPEKMLCGSGVVFKLIQALLQRLNQLPTANYQLPTAGWEKWLLDMVGLATLSDMVPLTGENRVLAYYGLKVLRKSPRVGLGQLLQELRLNRADLTEDDVGFSVTPRINAASRMGEAMDAFRLFATGDEAEAGALARHLNRVNDARKGHVAALVKEARKIVAERHTNGAPLVVVAGNPNWRPALLGLVANALAEDFRKPVFLWGRGESVELKGSCRSGGSVDVSLLMQEARHVFADFGGHKEAGGFSTTIEKVHLLEGELERAYERVRAAAPDGEPEERCLSVDFRLSLDEVRLDVWREIERLAPFGVGNPKPLFLFEQVAPVAVEQFGREGQHLKLIFQRENGEKISAVKFYAKPEDFSLEVQPQIRREVEPQRIQKINLLAHLEKSTFGNRTELRLRIVDIV